MQCCSSECIVAVKFEAHPIFKQVLLFRVHKHASIARLANCRPVPLYNLFSTEFHELHAFKHVCWAVRDTRGQTYVANVNTNAMEVCVTSDL